MCERIIDENLPEHDEDEKALELHTLSEGACGERRMQKANERSMMSRSELRCPALAHTAACPRVLTGHEQWRDDSEHHLKCREECFRNLRRVRRTVDVADADIERMIEVADDATL
jgi:hypothetical protein